VGHGAKQLAASDASELEEELAGKTSEDSALFRKVNLYKAHA